MDIRKSKNITTITLVMVFTVCFILGIIRWMNIFNENVFVITKEINSHITNFTISLMLCTLIGYLLLCYRKKYSTIIIIGLIIISTNLIYETILPFINTIDLIDVVYEVVDSRMPLSSKIVDIDDLIKDKPRIMVMTKYDLCDKSETDKIIKYYDKK